LHDKWQKFINVSDDKHVQAVIAYLLLAIKALLFLGLPGFGVLIIGVGYSIVQFLKIENEGSQNKI
jgi:hypothetical protein